MDLFKKIESLVKEKIEGTDLFIVDSVVDKGNRYLFYIDGDHGITIEKCSEIGRYVSHNLDEEELGEEKFTIEVSSPGIDRPLKMPRQYMKNAGRTLAVVLNDGETVSGKLVDAGEEEILLEIQVKEKGKKASTEERKISFGAIKEAKVLVSFKK